MKRAAGARELRFAVLPALLLVGLVVGLPVLRVATLSLSRFDLETGFRAEWTGLDHYARLWQDGRWIAAVRNTTLFTTASLAAEMTLGIAFALLLNRGFRGRAAARAAVLLPWALPTAVMALAWSWIFNDSFGVANDLLRRAGLLDRPVAWLGAPGTAMAALVVADVWKTTPFVMIIALAGLQSIPDSVIEAARLDGLGAWRRFVRVTLPLLVPALTVALVFRAVQAYGAFDLIYVMTGGGPGGATETVSLYAYQNYFRYLDFGYGSAIAVQGMLLAGLLAVVALRLLRRAGA